ncbi:MAG: cysteine desulfurase family protein [Anaerolineae bacterium]
MAGSDAGRPPLVYLDHSATTPLSPGVMAAMRPYLEAGGGNPSGSHAAGRRARVAVETARSEVAGVLGCRSGEVVFTSGGTEADNLALRGMARAALRQGRGRHVVVSAVEHEAVLHTASDLSAFGIETTIVGVDAEGRVDPDDVASAVRDDTILVSMMLANNEVGTIEPVADIGRLLRRRGVPLHTDAVQAPAWLDLDVEALGVDLLSLSAHKFYGPKGVGLLYVREGTAIDPVQTGGGQEHGLRSGTENVAGIVGLAHALRLAADQGPAAVPRVRELRDALAAALESAGGVHMTGSRTHRLPGHLSVCVEGVRADTILLGLDMAGICASSGSACATGRLTPSHVLTAMGVPGDLAQGALRLTLGYATTAAEVEFTTDTLKALVRRARESVAP